MHFGQKDTEDDSVRITIFLQSRPLHLKGVSLFSFPSSSSFIFSLDSTFKLEEYEDDEDEADAAVSAAVEVARVDEAAVGMGGGKSSSSPVFIAVVVDDFVADFDFDDDIDDN